MSDRETELQVDNTRLITELRETRAKLIAARKLLHVTLVEGPLESLLAIQSGKDPAEMRAEHRELLDVYHRIELLEKDAWTMTGPLARQFVHDAKIVMATKDDDEQAVFLKQWVEKFATLVGD